MHEYNIALADIAWFQAGVDQPGRREQVPILLPNAVSLTPIVDRSLDDMLVSGEIDAVITAHPPHSFDDSDGPVRRLFEHVETVEREYFERTRIFPVMHIVAIRRSTFDAHPWIARNLFTAFERARERAIARLRDSTASRVAIPWSRQRSLGAQALLGTQFWSYGIEPNRPSLEPFLQNAYEQGVCLRRLDIDELVPKELREAFRI